MCVVAVLLRRAHSVGAIPIVAASPVLSYLLLHRHHHTLSKLSYIITRVCSRMQQSLTGQRRTLPLPLVCLLLLVLLRAAPAHTHLRLHGPLSGWVHHLLMLLLLRGAAASPTLIVVTSATTDCVCRLPHLHIRV